MENTDNSFYSNVVPRFPEHLKETMEKLPLDLQQRLYVDIFKPLDFYELLFQENWWKTSCCDCSKFEKKLTDG